MWRLSMLKRLRIKINRFFKRLEWFFVKSYHQSDMRTPKDVFRLVKLESDKEVLDALYLYHHLGVMENAGVKDPIDELTYKLFLREKRIRKI